MKIPRIMITAVSSGSGKTTLVCGILKALLMKGFNVKSCKCGPDYIDPMFHKKVLGIQSVNADLFFVNPTAVISEHCENADITVFEGVMGYYDGLSFDSTSCSSFDISQKLSIPSILVVDARGMALSATAIIKGFVDFKADNLIKGFILNNVSETVYNSLKPIIEKNTGIKGFGFLPHLKDGGIESRHLGLMTPESIADINDKITAIGNAVKNTVDVDGLVELAQTAEEIFAEKPNIPNIGKIRTAIARDSAFCFYYDENIRLLEKMGCEIIYFSPLNDERLPENIDLLIIGGGYPELYAKRLSENKTMLKDIKTKLENGLFCLAECGGFMYLGKEMEDENGKIYKTVGFLDGKSIKKDKLVRFGYITLKFNGYSIKAHEFHYWDSTENGSFALAEKPNGRKWECMVKKKNTFAGFPHLYYYSNIDFTADILRKCKPKLISVMGGSGSGKSEFAENKAVDLHKQRKGKLYYVACMLPNSDEADERIKRHRKQRYSKSFETIECYRNLKNIQVEENSVVLIECMSNLLANEMFCENPPNDVVYEITEGIKRLYGICDVVVVTNDIFSDGNSYDKMTEKYMLNLAQINKYLFENSDISAEVVYSIPIYHRKKEGKEEKE